MGDWQEILRGLLSGGRISILLKAPFTLFVGILIPAYWSHYGPANFLWFSDIALLVSVLALWLENPFLASMQAVSITLLEGLWMVDFFGRLMTGNQLIGLADYMFKRENSRLIRGLSLFHLCLPWLLLWMVYRLGYDRRAWIAQSVLAWMILLICYFFTKPSDNINWVFGPGKKPQAWMAPGLYLVLLMIVLSVCVYFPTHLALQALMPRQLK